MMGKVRLAFAFAVGFTAVVLGIGSAGETAKSTVDLSIYSHVGSIVWVAKDLDSLLKYWGNLGLGAIERTNVTEFTGLTYRGKPAPTMARSAFGRIGNVRIEWIQPV